MSATPATPVVRATEWAIGVLPWRIWKHVQKVEGAITRFAVAAFYAGAAAAVAYALEHVADVGLPTVPVALLGAALQAADKWLRYRRYGLRI